MKSLTLKFNNEAAANAARTYLVNQTAPFRNSSTRSTKGVDVNTGEKFESNDTVNAVTFATESWANRADRELTALFADPNLSTCGAYSFTR